MSTPNNGPFGLNSPTSSRQKADESPLLYTLTPKDKPDSPIVKDAPLEALYQAMESIWSDKFRDYRVRTTYPSGNHLIENLADWANEAPDPPTTEYEAPDEHFFRLTYFPQDGTEPNDPTVKHDRDQIIRILRTCGYEKDILVTEWCNGEIENEWFGEDWLAENKLEPEDPTCINEEMECPQCGIPHLYYCPMCEGKTLLQEVDELTQPTPAETIAELSEKMYQMGLEHGTNRVLQFLKGASAHPDVSLEFVVRLVMEEFGGQNE